MFKILFSLFFYSVLALANANTEKFYSDTSSDEEILRQMRSLQNIKIKEKAIINYDEVREDLEPSVFSGFKELWLSNNIEAGKHIEEFKMKEVKKHLSQEQFEYLSENSARRTARSAWMYINCKDYINCTMQHHAFFIADSMYFESLNKKCQFLNQEARIYIKYFDTSFESAGFGDVKTYRLKNQNEEISNADSESTQEYTQNNNPVYNNSEEWEVVERRIPYINSSLNIVLGIINKPEYELLLNVNLNGQDFRESNVRMSENQDYCLKAKIQ